MYLEYFANNTDYRRTRRPDITFGYSARQDIIVYNDSHASFWDFPFEVANTHELSHRIDHLLVHSESNQVFSQAILEAAKLLDPPRLQEILHRHKDVCEDEFLCDILSGILGRDDLALAVGHSAEYWAISGNKEKEIFANLFSLESLQRTKVLSVIQKEFPAIFEAYTSMMEALAI